MMPRNQIGPFEVSRAQISYEGLWHEVFSVAFSANLNLLGFTRWDIDRNEIWEVDTTSVGRIVYFGHKIYPWDQSIVFTLGIEEVGAAACTCKSSTSEPITGPPGPPSVPFDSLYPGIARIELQFHERAIDSTLPKPTLINSLQDHSGEFRLLPLEHMALLQPPPPGVPVALEIKSRLTATRSELFAKTERSRLEIESALEQISEHAQHVAEIEAILADLTHDLDL